MGSFRAKLDRYLGSYNMNLIKVIFGQLRSVSTVAESSLIIGQLFAFQLHFFTTDSQDGENFLFLTFESSEILKFVPKQIRL